MEIALTWNLVLLAVFVMVFSYNFLLGQNATVKLIISIYIAILTADGIAGLVRDYLLAPSPGFAEMLGENQESFFVVLRIILFLAAIVIFVVKGGFKVELEKHEKLGVRSAIHTVFSALASCLFIATILIYLSGNSFVEGMREASTIVIYQQSLLAQILIDYYQIWFSAPAIAFLVVSFLFEKKSD